MLFSRSETYRGVELIVGFIDSMLRNLSIFSSWCPSLSSSSSINCCFHIFEEKEKVNIGIIFAIANVAAL